MIEEKLQNAANKLPDTRSNFLAVEEKAKQKKYRPRATPRRRFAIVMVLAILLVGCVAVSEPDYHLYNGTLHGYGSGVDELYEMAGLAWKDTQKAANKLGISLPETLGGHGVIDYSRYNLTNQEVPYWYALLAPRYIYQESYYGIEKEEPWVSPDGIPGTRHWREGAGVTYGPTDDEIWRRQFGYDENNVFVAGNWILANHPVVDITSFEYEGMTIYVGQIDLSSYTHPYWDVTWVDHENGVVFSLDGEFENPDTLIQYAKEIVDLNR